MHLADAFIQSDLVHSGYTFCLLSVWPDNFEQMFCKFFQNNACL